MALITCRECGHQVSDQAAACPSCGAPVERVPSPILTPSSVSQNPSNAASVGKAFLILVGLGVGFVILASINEHYNPAPPLTEAQAASVQEGIDRQREQRAIEYCDDRYKEMNADRQYTPEMLRFHSTTCDKMRSDYRAKWGQEP